MARYEIAGLSVSTHGAILGRRILETLNNDSTVSDSSVTWYHRPEFNEPVEEPFVRVDTSLTEWFDARFRDSNVLIFIGNVSRAFMLAAPYASDYADGMAILVIDEFGKFCVPLLSGRRNEGMEFASLFQRELGITAVNMLSARKGHDFSIERFARENRMTISNPDYAREIAACLEEGKPVGLYTNYRFKGALPFGMEFTDEGETGIYISPSFHNVYFDRTLWLIPRCVIVDLDCAPDTIGHSVLAAVEKVFKDLHLYQEAIEKIRVPEALLEDKVLAAYCADREIALGRADMAGRKMRFDEDGCEYEVLSRAEAEEGILVRIAMKNITLRFLG